MKFFKRLRKAWSVLTGEEDRRTALKSKIMQAVYDDFNSRKKPVSEDHYVDIAKASQLARDAHMMQNGQIDRYFVSIVEEHIDPFSLSLFRDEGKPIPGLASNIHYFSDVKQTKFGRRVTISFRERLIGDAIFTASFNNGKINLDIEEKIKIKTK